MITRREPALSSRPKRGWKLSPRRLATLIGNIAPDAISLPAVEEMLTSTDALVRYWAAELLAKRGDRDARLILERHLAEGRPITRASVARHLHALSWFSAEPLLRVALVDAEPRVRENAIFALCTVATYDAYQMAAGALNTETDDMVLLAAAVGLRQREDPEAAPLLGHALRADDPEVRIKALESLAENATPPTIPIIEAALLDDDPDVLDAAAQSLIDVRGADGVPLVMDRIAATKRAARGGLLRGMNQACNRGFVDLGTQPYTDALLDLLAQTGADDLPPTRLRTVMLLAWIFTPRSDELLATIIAAESDPHLQAEMHHIVQSLREDRV